MSIKLVILGLLHEGQKHPYEIRQILKERKMEHYIKLADGSLYYAVEQLHKKQLIEAVEVITDTNRPDKTIYGITAAGKAAFQDMLLKKFSEKAVFFHPLYAALPFSRHAENNQLADIISNRITQVKNDMVFIKETFEKLNCVIPLGTLYILDNCYQHNKTELEWLKKLQSDAENGRLGQKGLSLEINW